MENLVYSDLLTGETKQFKPPRQKKSNLFWLCSNYREAKKKGENCLCCLFRFNYTNCKKIGASTSLAAAIKLDNTCDFFKPGKNATTE